MSLFLSPVAWVLMILMPFVVTASVLYPLLCARRLWLLKRHGQTLERSRSLDRYFKPAVLVSGVLLVAMLGWSLTAQEPRISMGDLLLSLIERGGLGILVQLIFINLLCHVWWVSARASHEQL